jgi:hypothetical protein
VWGGGYDSNGDCGEEEGISNDISGCERTSSRGDGKFPIHRGVIPIHPRSSNRLPGWAGRADYI